MALFRGIQEYITRDANNIARVEAIQYYIITTVFLLKYNKTMSGLLKAHSFPDRYKSAYI